MLRKLILFCLMFGGLSTVHAQFAKRSFAPQLTTELSPEEAQRLRTNLSSVKTKRPSDVTEKTDNPIVRALQNELQRLRDSVMQVQVERMALRGKPRDSSDQEALLTVFGVDFFKSASFSFAPGENFPTPASYVVGPGDVIDLVIFGYQETEMELKVSPEGSVNIPFGGVIQVSGLNLNEVEQRIKVRMARNGYQTLSSGESKLKLSISRIRSINVYIVGAKNSGKYMIPSVSGVMHALYASGGPMDQGSFRNIELVRNGKVIQTVDLYDFMISGRSVNDVVLQNNDILRIPFFTKRVALDGAFKRPAIYELKEGETYRTAISFAGGLTDDAFGGHIVGRRVLPDQGNISFNIHDSDWDLIPQGGDRLTARAAKGPEQQFIVVQGAVFNPGIQGWTPASTAAAALSNAGGAHPNAFRGRALIVRSPFGEARTYHQFTMNEDLTSVILQNRDTVLVLDRDDFINPNTIQVLGSVKEPGIFEYGNGLTLTDALSLAKGFTKDASKGVVVVSRSIRSRTRLAEVYRLASDSTFHRSSTEFELKPGDIVMVRPNPDINEQRTVTLEGEWTLPGVYALQSRYDRLRSVYGEAEGLTTFADRNGMFILRPRPAPVAVQDLQPLEMSDSANAQLGEVYDTIALTLTNGRHFNFALKNGDRVIALEQDLAVRISGSVNQSTYIMHAPNRRAKYYVNAAGGFNPAGMRGKTFVRLPNGKSRTTRDYGIVRIYPRVAPGAQIIVPADPEYGLEKKGIDPVQITLVTSVLGFLSTTTIAIIQLLP
jgi:protein involved in polysaccharide export with SLBB domain